jgi:hypothetical protein
MFLNAGGIYHVVHFLYICLAPDGEFDLHAISCRKVVQVSGSKWSAGRQVLNFFCNRKLSQMTDHTTSLVGSMEINHLRDKLIPIFLLVKLALPRYPSMGF